MEQNKMPETGSFTNIQTTNLLLMFCFFFFNNFYHTFIMRNRGRNKPTNKLNFFVSTKLHMYKVDTISKTDVDLNKNFKFLKILILWNIVF